jgi:hypothetical protein
VILQGLKKISRVNSNPPLCVAAFCWPSLRWHGLPTYRKPKQIVVAAMRKLLVLCFGVLKTGRPFDAAIAMGG